MSDLIFYIGPFSYPNGGAAARRIKGNISTLQELGYEVKIIDGDSDVCSKIDGDITVYSVGERPHASASILKKINQYFFIGQKSIDFIKRQKQLPRYIILYSGYSPYLFRFLKFCNDNKIKLIFDCVEWYLPKSSCEYVYNAYYWNIELAMRILIPKCDGVICISSYLENYYKLKACKTINIPPTLSIDDLPHKTIHEINGPIRLIYSGSPGHKDLLQKIVDTVSQLSGKFELDIVGVNGVNSNNVRYHGRVDHEESVRFVSDSHFSILFRPSNKTSQAGFSTKVVESMSCATPVITNNTGDLGKYINDGVNGYIFDGFDNEILLDKLNSIYMGFSTDSYKLISQNSLRDAKDFFSYNSEVNLNKIKCFFDDL
ncbi:glycosyltransferase [Citrobacter portucalensis]|uniref:glycosyltransferase n=1 Tax=Citrobacter portucalensis TaxID=1639133 RepID=UPI00388E4B02